MNPSTPPRTDPSTPPTISPSPSLSTGLIAIEHLDFTYGSQPTLRDITLSVESGTTLGLIGPNGGGKTTLVKLLLGLLKPDRGAITIDGLPPTRAVAMGDRVGYLPQNPRLPANFPLDVRGCIRLGLAGKTGLLKGYHADDLAFADHLLDAVGLRDHERTPIGRLSGGFLQRVLIARALAPRPKVLILDEPTVGIDPAGQQQFIESLQRLKAELALTVVFVSHDLRAVTSISDRVACLNQTLHYHDTPQRLPTELAYRMFACDLAAMGVGACGCPS